MRENNLKVEKIQEDSLDSIPSPSTLVKILIIGRKVYLKEEGKTLLGNFNKLFVFKSLLTTPNNALPLHLKLTFPQKFLIFIDSEGDGMKSRLPFKKKSTL
jgi:hypothetical protein